MIICHCNILTSDRIEAAAADAIAEAPGRRATPEQVFLRCGARPNCGSCRETIRGIIEHLTDGASERA